MNLSGLAAVTDCACAPRVSAARSGSHSSVTTLSRKVKPNSKSRLVARTATLDRYEGQADSEFSQDYMDPNKGPTDDSDMEYEHPADLERPEFHPMGARGFVSDPCGPLYDPKHERYHLFFQNVPDSTEWKFGIVWGHVSSKDLVHWQHHPPALVPGVISPKKEGFFKWDADGCFTGCATITPEGIPTILYTGVRLRNNKKAGPFPRGNDDTGMPFFEAQLNAAHSDPDDEFLEVWTKQEGEALAESPPAELRPAKEHTGWRDPFIFEYPSMENDMHYSMLVGNGSDKTGGRALVYTSKSLTSGWTYHGTLIAAENTDDGTLWEYPLLVKLPQAKLGKDGQILFEYSPQEVGVSSTAQKAHVFFTGPDAPVNPCIYWVGEYDKESKKFLQQDAHGPFRLDIGEILYAVNSIKCPKGRQLLWGWLQEGERDDHGYSYSGCHSVPRELMLKDDRVVQRPIEEMSSLRRDNILSKEEQQELEPSTLSGLPQDAGNALDIEVTLHKGSAKQTGLLIGSWAAGGRGTCALLYDWDRNYLEAIFDTHFVCPRTAEIRQKPFSNLRKDLNKRTVGGPLEPPIQGETLKLRAFLDGSCLEVFTDTGAALTTRVYRGMRPKDAPSDIGFMTLGGTSSISQVNVWKMANCWVDIEEWNKSGKEPCKQSELSSATNIEDDTPYGEQQIGRCKACNGLHRKGACPVFKGGYHPGESRDED